MSVMDVTALRLGASLGDGLRVTAVLVASDIVAVGTDSGCVLAFAAVPGAAAAACVYARALHCGAVHALCLSPAALFASAGRDAAVAVQPTAQVLSGTARAEAPQLLRGHTLPVAAMAFFAAGASLATCGIGGRLIVFDASSRAALCDVRVGFAARCIALSPDESVCFVGGAGLARVDLYTQARPTDPLAAAPAAAAAVRQTAAVRYRWPRAGEEKEKEGEGEEEKGLGGEEDGECVHRIDVSSDGRLTAHICRGTIQSCATWTHTTPDFWISRDRREMSSASNEDKGNSKEKEEESATGIRAIALCAGGDAPIVPCAPYGRSEWCVARVRTVAPPPILSETERSTEEKSEAVRVAALQEECDELVRRIREELALRARKESKRKRVRPEAAAAE